MRDTTVEGFKNFNHLVFPYADITQASMISPALKCIFMFSTAWAK